MIISGMNYELTVKTVVCPLSLVNNIWKIQFVSWFFIFEVFLEIHQSSLKVF